MPSRTSFLSRMFVKFSFSLSLPFSVLLACILFWENRTLCHSLVELQVLAIQCKSLCYIVLWNVYSQYRCIFSVWEGYSPKCRATVTCYLNNIVMILPQNFCTVWSCRLVVCGPYPPRNKRLMFSPKCPDWDWGKPSHVFTGCWGILHW